MDDADADLDTDDKAIARAMAILTEHFPNVSVFASRVNDDGLTEAWNRWQGNWHACHGQVREWLTQRNAEARVNARRDMDED